MNTTVNLSRLSFKVGDYLLNGRYEVLHVLTENSGMANVYVVGDTDLSGKKHVVKQVINYKVFDSQRPDGSNPYALREFEKKQRRRLLEFNSHINEANVMSQISHPSIPRITHRLEDPNGEYSLVVMDYVEGKTVSEMLIKEVKDKSGNPVYTEEQEVAIPDGKGGYLTDSDGHPLTRMIPPRPKTEGKSLPEFSAVNIATQVCVILSYLHSINVNKPYAIAYRDLKPANLRITVGNKQAFLLDYGTAKIIKDPSEPDMFPVGTKGYAPEEQKVTGGIYDVRYDLYSLGVTLYNMLTGVSPTARDKDGRSFHKKGTPFSPREINDSISVGLDGLIRKATDPDPEKRFQSSEEMLDALRNYSVFDKGYRRKTKRKIRIASSFLVGSLALGLGSTIPFALHNQEEGQKYNNAISIATQSGRIDDYVTAISMEPTKINPYNGLINAIKQDGMFTLSEEKNLLGIINPNIDLIKKQEEYSNLAYEVGRLYWFYYTGDSDKVNDSGRPLSTKWFYDAVEGNAESKDLASVYYNLGEFDKTISSAIKESNDLGKYKEYWSNLIEAQTSENGEVVNLQIYNTLASCIDNYSHRLKSDGVSKDEILDQIERLEKYVINNRPTAGVPTDLYNQLSEKLPSLQDKVNLAYRGE